MTYRIDDVRTAVAITLLAAAASAGSYAQAQDAQPAQSTTSSDDTIGLEEIVVTAERREETVQRSSLALDVVGSAELETGGVKQAADLQNVIPGLTVSSGGATVQTYMRGVGSFATDAAAESSIAYNINGVYISRPNAIGPIFYDLARVEVLKGPQGTLYGRNASGGAINLITNRPGRELGGSVALEGGNFSLKQFTGVLNLPLGETFALRGAAQLVDRDGYLTDGYDDQDTQAGRLTALWEPSETVSLLVTGEYTAIGGLGAGVVRRSSIRAVADDEWTGPSEPSSQPPTAAIPGGTRILRDGDTDVDVKAVSAELNWELPFATLTFLPAYRDSDIAYLTYTPGFRFDTAETSKQQSYELRLAQSSERLKWVGGLYYFDEDQTELYRLNANPIQASIVDIDLLSESWAVFGQTTFSVTDTVRLIGGLRYSDEDKSQRGQTTTILPAPGGLTNNAGDRNFTDLTWKAGVELDVAPQSMLFFTAATGFKAGGFFPSVLAPNNAFEPEELLAYTLGSRNRFMENRLQLNVETFYWDYKDKQERFLGATPSGTTGLLTTNAGAATLYGVNIDLELAATANDSLQFGVEYLKTEYDEFTYTAYNPTPNPYQPQATTCQLGTPVPFAGTVNNPVDTTQSVNCAGKELVRAPEWSGSATYAHTFNLGGAGQFITSLNSTFSSSQFISPDFIDTARNDSYATANLDLTFYSASGRWSIGAWGRNLTDEAIYTGGFRYPFSTPVAAGGDPSLFYATIRSPRSYGLRAKVDF